MSQGTRHSHDGKRHGPKSDMTWLQRRPPIEPPQHIVMSPSTPLESVSKWVRIIYVVALLGVAIPMLLSGGLRMGGTSAANAMFGSTALLIAMVAIWRAYQVIRDRWRLASPPTMGFARWARVLAVWLMTVGATIVLIQLLSVPIARGIFGAARTESGAEIFTLGVVAASFGNLGPAALLLFEFTRLIAFEQAAREGLA